MNKEIPFIQFQNLTKQFREGPVVLDGLNLDVSKGEFISLIGPSGCGKSTILRLLSGLLDITSGQIVVDGMTPENAREESFFVFQEPNLLPWLRVQQNVEVPLKISGSAKADRRERASRMIDLVGLKDAARKYPWQLSGGMKMRVSIARALTVSPELLLLDEPFGALDEMTRDRLNEELLMIRETDPFTAFFVTHSVAEAVFLSSRIIVLSANPGKIADIIEIDFPYPRKAALREEAAFLDLLAQATHSLRAVQT